MLQPDVRLDSLTEDELGDLVQRQCDQLIMLRNDLDALTTDFKLFLKRLLFWMNDKYITTSLLKHDVCQSAFDVYQELLVDRRDAGRSGMDFYTDVGENHPAFDHNFYY
ncbi:hypothetical protein ACFE04_021335 [Oxalis oulophora]